MKRKIEFRGKREDNGEWVYGDLRQYKNFRNVEDFYCIDTMCMEEKFGHNYDVDPNTLGQFTGLLDKGGKKIYEGDIVKFLDSDSYDEAFENAGVVEYCDNGFYITNRYSVDMEDLVDGSEGIIECEILGNIYDNKDLLE